MNTVEEALDILSSWRAGMKIQAKSIVGWVDYSGESIPDFRHVVYRVKPKNKKFYISFDKEGNVEKGDSLYSVNTHHHVIEVEVVGDDVYTTILGEEL
jgi:hypothetical protein